MVKYKVAEQYGTNPRLLRLYLSDREIRDEGKQLQELKIEDHHNLYVKKRINEPKRLLGKIEEKQPVIFSNQYFPWSLPRNRTLKKEFTKIFQ